MGAEHQVDVDKISLFSAPNETIPQCIQDSNFARAQEMIPDIGNYKASVLYALSGELGDDPKTKRVLRVSDLELDDSVHSAFVGQRQGTTTSWSSHVGNILSSTGVEARGRVEKIIWHSYDSDSDNTHNLLGNVWHDQMTQMSVPDTEGVTKMFDVGEKKLLEYVEVIKKGREYLEQYNKENGLAMYTAYVAYLHNLFVNEYKRNPTDAEVYAFAFANSEHCNHGVFKGYHEIDGVKREESLFDDIKTTNKKHPGKTKVAYVDDAAAYEGKKGLVTFTSEDGLVTFTYCKLDNTLKVESHNHPTRIFALEGAATGIGGLLRDLSAIGRGGTPNATTVTFIVSDLVRSFNRTGDGQESALDILAEGSIGAADYANKFGVPAITGNMSVLDAIVGGKHWGYDKPTAIVGGKGNAFPENVESREVPSGAKIVYIGGSNFDIGFGGGAASSKTASGDSAQLDIASVQRADAIMQSKVKDLINSLTKRRDNNPILKIGDVGASGWTNTVQEILEDIDRGGKIDYSVVPISNDSMEPKRVLSNESQERYIGVFPVEDIEDLKKQAAKFGAPIHVIGEVTESTQYTVHDPETGDNIIDMDIKDMLGHNVELVLTDETVDIDGGILDLNSINLGDSIRDVISHPTVGDKSFLVTIGDRTVGGTVTRDQMVGPYQTPLSNVGVTLHGLEGIDGEVMTQANRAELAITSPGIASRMSVTTAVLKALSAYIPDLDSFSGSGNWMYAKGEPGQLSAIHTGVRALRDIMDTLEFDISVGKDSGSMKDKDVVSPVTLVTTLYADSGDVHKTQTPDLKPVKDTELFLVDFGEGKNRLGGSTLALISGQYGDELPDVDNPENIRKFMEAMIELHEKGLLLAYHKRSHGGLMGAISEMSFASHIGIDIDIDSLIEDDSHENRLKALFSEEQGIIMQFEISKKPEILEILKKYNLDHLGHTIGKPNFDKQNIGFSYAGEKFVDERRVDMQKAWSSTTKQVRSHRKNNNPVTTQAEFDRIDDEFEPPMENKLTFDINEHPILGTIDHYEKNNIPKPKMAVLSAEGTNSQEEMKRYFHRAGFEVYDIHINDVIAGKHKLDVFKAIAIAGGFSHGDVLGAGAGFAQSILENPHVRSQFQDYKGKILGVCNGFQVLTELSKILEGGENFPKLVHNDSNAFEARRVLVEVTERDDSIFFKGMGGSILSQIQSHGEGKVQGGNMEYNLNYVDHRGKRTETYPLNPNGSPDGATGFECGNFGGMMGHPEREWEENSPWLWLAYNIREAVEDK